MKALVFTAFLTIASTACIAQTTSQQYTHSQIKAMTRNAKTPADYLALRDYYNHQADVSNAQAAEEKREWERRMANPTVYARKYPTPVDSAHYLYDSYVQKAKTSADLAQHYEQLANAARPSN
jgi:hypothetical protein